MLLFPLSVFLFPSTVNYEVVHESGSQVDPLAATDDVVAVVIAYFVFLPTTKAKRLTQKTSMSGSVVNPMRSEVLKWYHKIVKSAFTVPWVSDDDAMYVVSEARRLFRQNQKINDLSTIRRKLDEAEMRYEIALHYRIPYPRPMHKAQGGIQNGGIAYHPAYDSAFDCDVNPRLGDSRLGAVTQGEMGGCSETSNIMFDEVRGMVDTADGKRYMNDTVNTRKY